MTTVKQVTEGARMPKPIYNTKPYIVLSAENVVLAAGTLQHIKTLGDYYGDCTVEVRQHDLYMNDNTKLPSKREMKRRSRLIAEVVADLPSKRKGRPAKYTEVKKTRSVRLTDKQMKSITLYYGSLQKMVERIANSYDPDKPEFFDKNIT